LRQDCCTQSMFETCVNRGSELSAFRGVGFHVERRVRKRRPLAGRLCCFRPTVRGPKPANKTHSE
jgi:hypothetical protein